MKINLKISENTPKIYSYLELFPQKDLLALDEWMKCSLFYNYSDTSLLYSILRTSKTTALESLKFELEAKKEKTVSLNLIRVLMNDLKEAIEKFMSYQQLQKSNIQQQQLLVNYHLEHEKSQKLLEESVLKLKEIEPKTSYELYLQSYYTNYYPQTLKPTLNAHLLIQNLNTFYSEEYLKHLIYSFYYHEKNEALQLKGFIIKAIEDFITTQEANQVPIPLQIYYRLFVFLNDLKLEDYLVFKDLFLTHQDLYFSTIKDLYLGIRNIFYNLVNKNTGPVSFYNQEIYFWLNLSIEKGLLNKDGFLAPIAFYNLIISGLKLNEYEATFERILKYSPLLHPNDKATYTDCAWGYYYFYTNNLKKSAYHFMLLGLTDDSIILYAQIRLFQILYQRKEIDVLEGKLYYFEQKIKKIKFKNKNVKFHLELQVQILKLLLKSKPKTKLIQFIETHPNLLFKDWYLNQIERL